MPSLGENLRETLKSVNGGIIAIEITCEARAGSGSERVKYITPRQSTSS
jgi:hypothetical protein